MWFYQSTDRNLSQAETDFMPIVKKTLYDSSQLMEFYRMSWRMQRLQNLNLSHLPALSRHAIQQSTYDTIQKDQWWACTTHDVHPTVCGCHKHTKVGATVKQRWILKLFPATELLQFVAMKIQELFKHTTKVSSISWLSWTSTQNWCKLFSPPD